MQDKILQSMSKGGEVTVTNDGATILKSVYIDNPAAKVLVGECVGGGAAAGLSEGAHGWGAQAGEGGEEGSRLLVCRGGRMCARVWVDGWVGEWASLSSRERVCLGL